MSEFKKRTFSLACCFVAILIPHISFHHSLPFLSQLIMVNVLKHDGKKHTLIIDRIPYCE